MRTVSYTKQFKKDLNKIKRQGKSLTKLKFVMNLVIEKKILPQKYGDHPLKGIWKGSRDCHIEPDWILIYSIKENIVCFERTGSHSDLFF